MSDPDKIFKAYDVRGVVPDELDTEPLLRLNVAASDDAELAAVRDEALGLIREDTAR